MQTFQKWGYTSLHAILAYKMFHRNALLSDSGGYPYSFWDFDNKIAIGNKLQIIFKYFTFLYSQSMNM